MFNQSLWHRYLLEWVGHAHGEGGNAHEVSCILIDVLEKQLIQAVAEYEMVAPRPKPRGGKR